MQVAQANGSDPNRAIRIWLYSVAALVAVMVLVGGATRLTDSGLSITEWAPISGAIPPLSAGDWNEAFELYQQTTEFQTINASMTLDEFKVIFWWEWGHRFLGRLIGLVYGIPLVWFWLRGLVPRRLKVPLLVLLALGGLQGFIGWWMVKSGLVGRVDVSQIRLAIHLTLACGILACAVWIARSTVMHLGDRLQSAQWQAGLITIAILLQIFAGGLVAGLDAGMAFNTWPTMNGKWAPEGLLAAQSFTANLTDNAVMVQFNHRNLAYVIWIGVLAHLVWLMLRHSGSTHVRRAGVLFGLVCLQAFLGIAVLIMQVPLGWALLHQFGAVVVLAFAVAHSYAFAPKLSQDDSGLTKMTDVNLTYAHGNG